MSNDHNRTREITFFKSAICPRCLLAGRVLARLKKQYPQLRVRQIDVMVHPLLAARSGIAMIPALKAGDEILSMFFPGAEAITTFVEKVLSD